MRKLLADDVFVITVATLAAFLSGIAVVAFVWGRY